MARFTDEQILAVATRTIAANAGIATHEQLVAALDSNNMGSEAGRLADLVQGQKLKARVVAQVTGAPVLRYQV